MKRLTNKNRVLLSWACIWLATVFCVSSYAWIRSVGIGFWLVGILIQAILALEWINRMRGRHDRVPV